MMVFFSAPMFDVRGAVVLSADRTKSNYIGIKRRLTQTQALDGTSFVYDGGFSETDRALAFVVNEITENSLADLLHLCRDYTQVMCAIENEFFSGVLEEVDARDNIKVKYLIHEKLSL